MIKRSIVALSFIWLVAMLIWISVTLLTSARPSGQISELMRNVSSSFEGSVSDFPTFIDRITAMSATEDFGGEKVSTAVPLVRGAKIRLVAPGVDFVRFVYIGTSIADGHCVQATVHRDSKLEIGSVDCSSVFR